MRLWLLLALLFPVAVLAQGTVTGRAVNLANPEALLPDSAPVCAIFLPQSAHPFCEITSATWQQAFTDVSKGREVSTPLGKLVGGIGPVGHAATVADGTGSFRLDSLPLETRIGLAVLVDGLWWPSREELWLTASAPELSVQLGYCRLGAESPVLERHRLEAAPLINPDLKYAGITILETLRFTNNDPQLGALVEVVLDVAMVPGIVSMHLPTLYGSHLLYMQGWNMGDPVTLPAQDAPPMVWTLGGRTMHGSAPTYGKAAQASADNWHPLQGSAPMALAGAGDTLYRENPSADGRSASLVFRRVVPPARQGTPGVLEIRLRHQAGARTADPGQRTRLLRSFPLELQNAEARVSDGVTLQVLVTQSHRKLFADPVKEGRVQVLSGAKSPALAAGEVSEWIVGFSTELQQELSKLEALATGRAADSGNPDTKAEEPVSINQRAVFLALAAAFGLAFLVALVASVRKGRDQQLERLNRLPGNRDELLAALRELEAEYKTGHIPPTAFLEQKQRLLNRLIEHDAGKA
ncbi:MAG: hypothetical protein KF754_07755 [Planctomycetes bacterium]|nr:hypothetical protein [Planctomycetota bacterium]